MSNLLADPAYLDWVDRHVLGCARRAVQDANALEHCDSPIGNAYEEQAKLSFYHDLKYQRFTAKGFEKDELMKAILFYKTVEDGTEIHLDSFDTYRNDAIGRKRPILAGVIESMMLHAKNFDNAYLWPVWDWEDQFDSYSDMLNRLEEDPLWFYSDLELEMSIKRVELQDEWCLLAVSGTHVIDPIPECYEDFMSNEYRWDRYPVHSYRFVTREFAHAITEAAPHTVVHTDVFQSGMCIWARKGTGQQVKQDEEVQAAYRFTLE